MNNWEEILRKHAEQVGIKPVADPISQGRLLVDKDAKSQIGEVIAERINDELLNNKRNPLALQVYYRDDIDLPMLLNEPATDTEDAIDNKLDRVWVAISLRHGEMRDETWYMEVEGQETSKSFNLKVDDARLYRAISEMTSKILEARKHSPDARNRYTDVDPVVAAIALRMGSVPVNAQPSGFGKWFPIISIIWIITMIMIAGSFR